ncbi:hypothetical protein P7H56_06235 [Vagococcus lutrae]|uniref:hypothetical protein n=1 Tax=Vagococcus lutrae TaxID=81947 RepID=UPI0028902DD0|nr:hypothetical protein [Vagococcus lutrae]MDT2801868.1 hypothetical protein [Vagococcus lutrae]
MRKWLNIGAGIALGIIFGAAIESWAVGIGFAIGLGTMFYNSSKKPQGSPG